MIANLRIPRIALVLTVCTTLSTVAQQPSSMLLPHLIQKTQARVEWDPVRGHGALVRGNSSLAFMIGLDLASLNYTTLVAVEPPQRQGGDILFGPQFVARALELFPPIENLRRIAAIYIDPGHGGRDPGAIGTHPEFTLQEKTVVLTIGHRLQSLLSKRFSHKRIVLSREDDRYLTLEERTRLANAIDVASNETVIFISLHANASLNREARGFEVWFLPTTYRRPGLVSAEDVGLDDPDLLSILNTMREEEITLESVLLARNVLAGLEDSIGEITPNRGLREESWYVVRNASMPSILVEVGFVTNVHEANLLRDPAHLELLSQGIFNGIVQFVSGFEELGAP